MLLRSIQAPKQPYMVTHPTSTGVPTNARIMKLRGSHHLSVRGFLRFFAHVQMLPILESGEETLVGGQAVMEGVMMRAPHSYCVAVRKPNGEITKEEMSIPRISEKYPFFRFPL